MSYQEAEVFITPDDVVGDFTPENIITAAVNAWKNTVPPTCKPINLLNPTVLPKMTVDAERYLLTAIPDSSYMERVAIIPITNVFNSVEQVSKLTVTGDTLAKARAWKATGHDFENVENDLISSLSMRNVTEVEVVKLPAPKKAKTVKNDDAHGIFYRIVDPTRYGNSKNIQKGFASEKEACDEAARLMNEEGGERFRKLVVKPYVKTGKSSGNLAVISRPEPETANITVKATVQIPTPDAPVTEYGVRFWYTD